MKIKFLLSALIFITHFSFSQDVPQKYFGLVKKADSLYKEKEYKTSAFTYAKAFEANGWKGFSHDRYNAARSWALANYPDSSFFHLNRLAAIANYTNYNHISTDEDLKSLHQDKRWNPLLNIIKQNKEKVEANYNKPLVKQLDSIYVEDQKYRLQVDELVKKYGWDSKEMQALEKVISRKDSSNLIVVKNILDRYGWLGADVVGQQGNATLFLVIQHSNQRTQEKYLPMMREAVTKGKASGSSLALLEDRVALGQGKRQVYGSQIGSDLNTNLYYVAPLEDPDNVDKRRAQVGLPPLAEYVKRWDIKWDVEQYKKDLPLIEAREKTRH
jgi:hypothetical protein